MNFVLYTKGKGSLLIERRKICASFGSHKSKLNPYILDFVVSKDIKKV